MSDIGQEEWIHALRNPVSDKSWAVAFCLSVFLGWFGMDRLYLGYIGLGCIKLLTFGGFGFWWIVDLVLLLSGRMRDANGGLLRKSN
jgi:TM2 domain-containing membrane protein YozV